MEMNFDEFVQSVLVQLWNEDKLKKFRIEYVDEDNKKTIAIFKNDDVKAELDMVYFYTKYKESDAEKVYDELLGTVCEAISEMDGLKIPNIRDYNECLEFATMRLVQKKQKKTEQPFIDFGGDVFIVFQLDIQDGEGVDITTEMLNIWNVNVDKLFHDVSIRMDERYLTSILTLTQAKEIAEGIEMSADNDSSEDIQLIVTSDDFNYFGATAVFYPSMLETLKSMGDTWILFPSFNQALLFPGMISVGTMKSLIKDLKAEANIFSTTLLRFNEETESFSVE